MKLLVLGIDALGAETLSAFNLTQLARRLESAARGAPRIDNVVSRGWPELYTGTTAYESGAFYMVPAMAGKRMVPTFSTGLSLVKAHIPEDRLIWSALNKLGYDCGVLTVPTVSPAFKIDGFSVAATGAGQNTTTMGAGDFSPSDLMNGMALESPDLGLRIGYGAFLPDNLEALEGRLNKHIAEWFYLAEILLARHNPRSAFVVSRFLAGVGYKFIALCQREPADEFEQRFKSMVLSVCGNYDYMLDRFIEKIDPEHLFIVSDHGLTTLKWNVNLNELLVEVGVLRPNEGRNRIKQAVNLKKQLNPFEGKFNQLLPGYRCEEGMFFAAGYTNVIYLNDERFGGDEVSPEVAFERSREMAELLTAHVSRTNVPVIKGFEALQTKKYTEPLAGSAKKRVPLPNIRCHLADGAWNSHRTRREVVAPNHPTFSPEMFRTGFVAEYSGCKSEDTIAAYAGSHAELADFSSLPSVYRSILAVAEAAR